MGRVPDLAAGRWRTGGHVYALFNTILTRPDGFHPLASHVGSGALDVIRHRGLQNPACGPSLIPWSWAGRSWFFRRRRCECTRWWLESGTDAIQLLELYLLNVSRSYIFGEPYTTGLGLHNVHMNQGDPVGSSFARENGIWQDGGTILEYAYPQPRLSVLLT